MLEAMRRGIDPSGKTPAIQHRRVGRRRAAGTQRGSLRQSNSLPNSCKSPPSTKG